MGIMPKKKISMGTKRKQDQWRDDSSSSDAKRCRSCSAVCSDGPNDEMPQEGFSDTSFRDAVIELKDVIQVKVSTEEKFKRKVEKLKEKRKKDKNKHEEDLRILKKDLRILKKHLRILKEDHEELKLQIQEIRKEGCAEVNHYKASPSQRSQLSQSTRFRLVIENAVSRTIFKKETVETEDGGGHIKVVMYDGGNPIASDHPLASARVDLVVIEGSFNEPKRDSWSKEEFEESIIKPRKGITRLVKNGTFNLIGGSCDHEGAIIMDNSQQKEVKLGVMIAVHTGVRVLEGVSNPFKVQEGKTKKLAPNKKGNKTSPPVRTRNLVQPTNTHATQHGQGPDEQHSLPPPVIQGVLQKAEDNRRSYPPATVPLTVEGNGQALNSNSQQSSQQIPSPILWQSTSTHSMQYDQGCSLPPPSMQNPLQVAGYCPFNQHLLACDQDPFTSLPNASSQLAFPNLSAQASLNDIRQWTSFPEGEISVEDVNDFNVQTQIPEHYGTFRCGQVLLQWDKPHVELKQHWNFLDQLMPLYSTQSRFYRESFPSTNIMDKAHKLLASISSADSVLKMIPQRRGVLIQPIKPYDSDDEPPVKKQRNAKYQLRFVNRVCNDYYTWEQIKSEDGDLLKVALYDENNLVVTSGPLSSASVEVVLLHGDFNDERQDHWTLEDFTACLVHPQSLQEPPALGGDRVLALTDGEADIGNVYFRTSSFHARTGKFKMGVKIKNVREGTVFCESSPRGRYNFFVRVQYQNWNVQEGITSPFLVRVRQGKESSSHWIASLNTLLRVSKLVCGAWECDAKENVGASSALHDQLLQVGSVLGASMTEDHGNIVRMASDRPPEPSCHDVEWSALCTLLKAQSPQMNAKYQLRFFNRVCNDYYTKEHIKSEDGNLLKVALYDENNPVVTSGPLSSASEFVLLRGDFNAEGQDYWTSEEFSACLVHPQSVEGPPALGGDCVLALTEGEADLGNVNFQTSSFHGRTGKFKMGVNIKNVREESVQEGITSTFTGRVRQGEESGHHRVSSLGTLVKVRKGLPKQVCGALENIGRPAFHDPVAQEYKDDVAWLIRVASRVEDHDSMVQAASNRRPEPPSHGVECSAPSTFQIEKEERFLTRGREEINDAHDSATTVAEPSSPVKASRARCAPLFSINGRSKDD